MCVCGGEGGEEGGGRIEEGPKERATLHFHIHLRIAVVLLMRGEDGKAHLGMGSAGGLFRMCDPQESPSCLPLSPLPLFRIYSSCTVCLSLPLISFHRFIMPFGRMVTRSFSALAQAHTRVSQHGRRKDERGEGKRAAY